MVGQVAVTQAFLPPLRRSRGRIVLVGSIAGRSALPFLGAYAASKHALEALADTLRVELRPFGIDVALVEPGTIRTPIWDEVGRLARHARERRPTAAGGALRGANRASGASQPSAARRGGSVEAVVDAVENALTAGRPARGVSSAAMRRITLGNRAVARTGCDFGAYERLLLR